MTSANPSLAAKCSAMTGSVRMSPIPRRWAMARSTMPAMSAVTPLSPRGSGFGLVEDPYEPGQLELGGGQDDLLLGVVLVVDGGLGHPDLVGDHLQGRAADPVPGEEVEGRGEDPGLRGGEGRGTRGVHGEIRTDHGASVVAQTAALIS